MADDGVKALMETLHEQQELLQLLYTELDVEREASATATSESLGMILRLQGEKAAVEMDASQYKRIAEEKMVHTEETIEAFRDVIYQKEMQIASLDFQIQAYRYKLMSLGCNDVGEGEASYPENMLLRRMSSVKDEDLGLVKSGDFSSYSDQIRRLDERVKQLSSSKDLCYDAVSVTVTEACEDLLDMEPSREPVTPLKVHDVFEVPQQTPNGPGNEIDPVTPFAIKTVISDEMGKEKWDRKITMSPDIDDVLFKPRDGMGVEHLFCKRPEVTDFELHRRVERLEEDIIVARLDMPRQEITVEKDDDKLLLLNAIKDQLNSIEDEITQWRPKKPPPKKELHCTSFIEAMLHFLWKSPRTEEP